MVTRWACFILSWLKEVDVTIQPGQKLTTTTQILLTIAGFDPSSGAGITADLKTFAAHGVFGISCATALTVQSTRGVRRVAPVDAQLITATLDCLYEDMPIAGIKIGMLGTAAGASAVAEFLSRRAIPQRYVVLDPVLLSSSGATLLDDAGRRILEERLLTRVGWITPNLDELAILLAEQVAEAGGIPAQAARLQQMAARVGNRGLSIVVTGGHLEQPSDFFLDGLDAGESHGEWIPGERIETSSTHGTGCAFSSSLVCQLAQGHQGRQAVTHAKAYVTNALRHAYPIGRGRGPLNHLFPFKMDAAMPDLPADRHRQ